MKEKFFKKTFYYCFFIILLSINGCEFENDNEDSIEVAKNIIGTWKCIERDVNEYDEFTYDINIVIKDLDSTNVRIYNFYNVGKNYYVIGKVEGNILNLKSGSFGNGFILISGSGTISASYKKIEFTYTIDEGDGTKKKYISTYTKY